jgi:DNA-binding LytR/AlgR family response regulator
MRVLIIEDEIHNQRLLNGMIAELRPQWMVAEILESVSDSVEWLQSNKVDLIFMDIQLVDGVCFSIFEKTEINTPVIFTTAYDNFAIQAFKVNSIDYLLKPVKEEELLRAIEKYEKQTISRVQMPNYADMLDILRNNEKRFRNRILIHGAKSYFKIEVSDVAYFYSESKITFARMSDKSDYPVDMTLEMLEDELNPDLFFRAGRNILVHINSVISFEDYFGGKLILKLQPPFGETITVSRLKNSAFKLWIGK